MLLFFSHLLQYSGRQIKKLLSLVSGQGTGKGVVMEPRMTMNRRWNCVHVQKPEQTTGEFNGCITFVHAVFLDEQTFKKADPGRDLLKILVTESSIRINEKFKPSVSVPNTLNFIQASQNLSHVEPKERKAFLLRPLDELSGPGDSVYIVFHFTGRLCWKIPPCPNNISSG